MTDKQRIDFLEEFVNKEGALVLHDGSKSGFKFSGLGLRPGYVIRTLREAIDDCMGADAL